MIILREKRARKAESFVQKSSKFFDTKIPGTEIAYFSEKRVENNRHFFQHFLKNRAFLARFFRQIVPTSMIFSIFFAQFRTQILQFPCVELSLVRRLALTQELPSQPTKTSTFLNKKTKSQLLPTSPKSQKSVTV